MTPRDAPFLCRQCWYVWEVAIGSASSMNLQTAVIVKISCHFRAKTQARHVSTLLLPVLFSTYVLTSRSPRSTISLGNSLFGRTETDIKAICFSSQDSRRRYTYKVSSRNTWQHNAAHTPPQICVGQVGNIFRDSWAVAIKDVSQIRLCVGEHLLNAPTGCRVFILWLSISPWWRDCVLICCLYLRAYPSTSSPAPIVCG